MNYLFKTITAWLVWLLLNTFAHANDDVMAQIQMQNAKYEAAYNSGDAATVAALHTEDARVMVSGFPTSVGAAAIREGIAAETSGPATLSINLETVELDVTENMVYEKGRWATLIEEQGKADEVIKGPYLVIWKKVGNEWLIHFDAVFSE